MNPRIFIPSLAVLAALFALSSPGQAARNIVVPKKSVGTKHLKNKSVTSAKVRDGSLRLKDFKSSERAALVGKTGSRGPAGPRGVTGTQGPSGPKGPSGTQGVLKISGNWSGASLPPSQGATALSPANCRTLSHTAAAGEVAVLSLSATASPSAATNDVLYILPQVSVDSAAFKNLSPDVKSAATLSTGTTHVTSQVVAPLEAGKAYRFATGFSANSAGTTISVGYCQGTVTIVKAA